MHLSISHIAVVTAFVTSACASDGAGKKCGYTRTEGLYKPDVSLDPREADSPDESTTLEVRWEWAGSESEKAGGEVLPRVVEYHMTAQEALWRKEAWESLDKSRCTIEEPVAGCDAPRRIVFVEAEP